MNLTKSAAEKLREMAGEQDPIVVKVTIDPTAVSGVHPVIELDNLYAHLADKSAYQEHKFGDILVIHEVQFSQYLQKIEIDYYEGLDQKGFILN